MGRCIKWVDFELISYFSSITCLQNTLTAHKIECFELIGGSRGLLPLSIYI
jgi:hypothetical protein